MSQPKTVQTLVREMCVAYEHDVHDTPRMPPKEVQDLRRTLVVEEFSELMLAMKGGNLVEILAEASDLVIVLHGLAAAFGVDLDAVTRETLRSNMTKVMPDGTTLKEPNGKVIKPPTFEEADYSGILGTVEQWTP